MIQRIQTLYLFLIFALTLSMFFTKTIEVSYRAEDQRIVDPDGTITTTHHLADDSITLNLVSIKYTSGERTILWFSLVLLILSCGLPLFTIFAFHHRQFQLKLCFVEGVLIFGLIAFEVLYVKNVADTISDIPKTIDYGISAVFPFVCLVLIFMAGKGIIKDEALVASYDRLR